MKTVVGLFQDKNEARRTVDELKRLGVRDSDVSLISNEGTNGPISAYLDPGRGTRDPQAITRALCRMGLSENEADRYVAGIKQGYTLESVLVDEAKANDALEIMRAHSLGTYARDRDLRQGAQGLEAAKGEQLEGGEGETILPVIVEELAIGKREVGAGGVRATSRVASTRVVEEVIVEKDIGTRAETINDSVRRTDVDVQRIPYDASAYREHHAATYGKTGAKFDEYEPAYRYGFEMGSARDGGDDWSAIEPRARADWEKYNPNTWERFKAAIKHAWDKTVG